MQILGQVPGSPSDGPIPGTIQPGSSLEYWACVGRLDQVKLELQQGADVNHADESGYTALHAAAENNHVEIVRLLLEHGANRLAKVETGETPIDYAREHGYDEVVRLLEGRPS
jgi:ankyrin repeat protein